MHEQKGLTITGFVFVLILLFIGSLLAFRLIPVYAEYFMIQRQFRSMVEDPAVRTGQRAALEKAWNSRAIVERIDSLQARDIDIARQGDSVVISAHYSVRVPLFRNVSACLDFEPSASN
jgi:hypothetical protein